MILKAADWTFRVDVDSTREHTVRYSTDHCTCAYCRNYYDTVETSYPKLAAFLGELGIHIHGPVEVMPFEPTLVLVCYRVRGQILSWGKTPLHIGGVDILPEGGDADTFHLWAGPMALPWEQPEAPEDVVSPANLPEFMERMEQMWLLRFGTEAIYS